MTDNCPLCIRKQIEHIYYEDDLVWITDCKTCKCPLIVWKNHQKNCDQEEVDYIHNIICKVFGGNGELPKEYEIDTRMKAIPDHYHIHLRKKE